MINLFPSQQLSKIEMFYRAIEYSKKSMMLINNQISENLKCMDNRMNNLKFFRKDLNTNK